MSQKALTALIFLVVSLLSIVVVVGLAQRILDATGVAVALSTLLTGLVGGVLLRKPPPPGGSGGNGGDAT